MLPVAEVETASREARRRVRTSQGIYLLGVGLIMTVVGAGWVLAGPRADLLEGVFILVAGAASLALPLIVRRWRARNGVYVVPKGEMAHDDQGRKRVPVMVIVAFAAGFCLSLGIAVYLLAYGGAAPDDRMITGVVLCVSGLGFLGSFTRFRLWEELLMGAGCVAAGVLSVRGAGWGWCFFTIGVAALLTGALYQARWSRWVRGLGQAGS